MPPGLWVNASQAPLQVPFHYAGEVPAWNRLEISACWTRTRIRLNDRAVVDYGGAGTLDDATHRQRRVGLPGHLALQIPTGDELCVRFRNLAVRPKGPVPVASP